MLAKPQVQLERLQMMGLSQKTTVGLCEVLTCFAHCLQELSLPGPLAMVAELLDGVAHCQQLESLTLGMDQVHCDQMMQVLTSCQHLARLTMSWRRGAVRFAHVTSILQARQQFMLQGSSTNVHWLGSASDGSSWNSNFAVMLEQYSWLDYLQVGANHYAASDKSVVFVLTKHANELAVAHAVAGACAAIHMQTLVIALNYDSPHELVVKWDGTDIIHLSLATATLLMEHRAIFDAFQLTHIVSIELNSIAKYCPNIQHLALPSSYTTTNHVSGSEKISLGG